MQQRNPKQHPRMYVLPEERKANLHRYTCVMVGERQVGKTTIAVNFSTMKKTAASRFQRVQLWDAVDAKGKISTLAWESQAYMLVFSLIDRNSLVKLSKWYEIIKTHAKSEKIYIVVVGTKSDLRERYHEKFVPCPIWVDPELNTGLEYFNQIPYELVMYILSFLDRGSLWSVSKTCKFLQNCCNDSVLLKPKEDEPVEYSEGSNFAKSIGAKYMEITNLPPFTNFVELFEILPSKLKNDNSSCCVS